MVRNYFFLLFFFTFSWFAHAQQSNNVTLLGSWDDNSLPTISGVQFNDIWGYAADGKEFAIIGSQQKVHFLDVTNPSQINEIAAIVGGANTIWRDIKTFGTYAYSVADQGSEGLLVFDLSNITASSPSVSMVDQQTDVFTRAHNIFIDTDHGFLYVAGANTGGGADLLIYNLNNTPGSPEFVESVNLPGNYIHDVYVKDHVAYCSHGNVGLYIYNLCGITDPGCADGMPGTFVELGRIDDYQFQGYNHSSWVAGNTIVFADETFGSPLTSADLSDLSNITIQDYFQSNQLGLVNPTSIPHNPFILGNLLVVSYYHDGVVFYDLTDPAAVQEVGYYDTEPSNTDYTGFDGCWGVYPFLPSGRVIASDVLNGLFVLEPSAALQDLANGGGSSCDVGDPCDDGDPNTFNDVFDANCDCSGTSCAVATVQGLSATSVGADFAELMWDEVPGATYRLQYRESGTNSISNVTNITDNTYVLTGLSAATTYQVRIRSECDTDFSAYSPIGSFTTTSDCPAAGLPCDDGNPNTENDVTDGNCGCAGTFIGDCTVTTIDGNDFEGGLGIWNDGGADCILLNNGNAANSGSFSVLLRDDSETSVLTTDDLNLSSFEEATVSFNYITRSMENGEDFLLQLSVDGGISYNTVASWVSGTDFSNRNREFESVAIPGVLTSSTRFRFRCDASANNDIVYIDDVVISGCGVSTINTAARSLVSAEHNTVKNSLRVNQAPETSSLLINDLRLAPNPTRDILNVNLNLAESNDLQVFVTNLAGQRLFQQAMLSAAGNFNLALNTSSYQPGIYFLTVRTAEQQLSQKFVVIE